MENLCEHCDIEERLLKTRLHVHHIDSDKKNYSESNLIPLCPSCHSKVQPKFIKSKVLVGVI